MRGLPRVLGGVLSPHGGPDVEALPFGPESVRIATDFQNDRHVLQGTSQARLRGRQEKASEARRSS